MKLYYSFDFKAIDYATTSSGWPVIETQTRRNINSGVN